MVRPALCCFSAGPFCSGGRRASDWRAVTRHILSPVSSLSSPSRLNTNHLRPQRVRNYPSQPFTAWQTSAPHVTQLQLEIACFLFLFDVCQEFLKAVKNMPGPVWYVCWKHGGPVGWHVPCGSSLATASPPTKSWRLVSSDNLRRGGRMQADISNGGCWRISHPPFEGKQSGEHILGVQMSPVRCFNSGKWEVCTAPNPCPPFLQDLNRAVTMTGASLPSLQDCCLPKESAVTYICQALLALPASENHFSLNFIMAYLLVFSSIVWFELWAPSVGFAEGKLVSTGWTLHFTL